MFWNDSGTNATELIVGWLAHCTVFIIGVFCFVFTQTTYFVLCSFY